MAQGPFTTLPDPPRDSVIQDELKRGSVRELAKWFSRIHLILSGAPGIAWEIVSKTGSSLTDIVTRPHSALQSILQADDTSSSTAGEKHVTDAAMKANTDHRNASQNVHGIGVGNSVVGTGTTQTISNKKYGGDANYTEFETDGTIHFVGGATVWDDIQFQISGGKVPAANFPDFDVFTANTKEYNFDIDDYINLGASEMAHWWFEETAGQVHLHVTLGVANATGSDRFAKYTVYIAYANVDSVWTETSATAELTIPDGTPAMYHTKLSLGNIDFTGIFIGAQVKATVKRIAATGGTEYANHTFITQCGIHVEKDTAGSRGIFTK